MLCRVGEASASASASASISLLIICSRFHFAGRALTTLRLVEAKGLCISVASNHTHATSSGSSSAIERASTSSCPWVKTGDDDDDDDSNDDCCCCCDVGHDMDCDDDIGVQLR